MRLFSTPILILGFSLCLNAQHISEFTSLAGGAQTTDFVYPSGHTFQAIIEEGDPLDVGGPMADRFDFTGYVPISSSSENGYLSISHEMFPGGVTILDIQFDPVIKAWSYTASEDVDFSIVEGTRNNCSGTVTPWGTIVTSEESTVGGLNSLTYNKYGWNIEIDPVTKTIIDDPSGGFSGADKLWAMGNFKHENIVVHPNQRTVYQAEDKTGGFLYKFVASTAGDLTSGDLFVYVGTKSGTGVTGDWVQIDNTTIADRNSTISQADAVGAEDFKGGEDVEINPLDGSIYLAVKNDSTVYRFEDDNPLGAGTVSNFNPYVGGTGVTYNLSTTTGIVNVPWGRGNDNLAFDDLGNLWVCQDGSVNDNNHIWVVDNGHTQANPKVRIFGNTPLGSEPTGLTFSPDYRFMFLSFQHPSAGNSASSQLDAFQQIETFDTDVAIVMARKEYLGNCHLNLEFAYPKNIVETYNASQYIKSSSTMGINADINYLAGDSIVMPAGFEVPLGAKYHADIVDCTVITP